MKANGDSRGRSDRSQRASVDVVLALAEAEDVDPVEIEPPLYTVVDPAALDSLFRDEQGASAENVEVTFEYAGREIRIGASGDVTVSERLDGTTSGSELAGSGES